MRILIADDDDVSRLALQRLLAKRGHDLVVATNGNEAWQALEAEDPPKMAILDWMMPELDGVEICRRLRAAPNHKAVYLILLTSRDSKKHILEGLESGANDYVTKPFDPDELQARVNVGVQMVQLQSELAQRVAELEEASACVNHLQGLLPMCSYCKSIRDDHDYWHRVEKYIGAHTDVRFSHGICPECWKKVVEPQLQEMGLPLPETSGKPAVSN
jgi:phosphoserine phosphatase RsbU/P